MIRFRTLGTADLTGVEGNAIVSVLAGPKRVALLAYLAVEGANGLVRRDTLLPLFWPESDTEHARASLRSALATLRRSLNDGVILVRGDDEVGVAEERLWCDAVEFRRLLAAGDLEQALELYRGEFLQGFFLAEAPEFEHWLERTRLALRNQAVEATVALAQRHEGSGDAELAARWAARASELDPEDERLLRQRLEMLERTGNRAAALRVYDEFARWLWQELEVEPSAQTQSLVHAIRAREAEAAQHEQPALVSVAPPRSTEVTSTRQPGPEAATLPRPEPDPEPHPPAPSPVRRFPLLAVLLVLAVALAGTWAVWQRTRSSDAPVSSSRIAVFPFSVRGADTLSYLGEGMVDLMSTKLDGIEELQPVDPRAVLGLVAKERVEYLDPERARSLARRLGAGRYVLGNILEAGGRLQLNASLYDQAGELESTAQVGVQNELHLFDLVDRLTAQLLAGKSSGPGARMTRLAASTTTSLPALKAYLDGERAFRRHRYDVAIDAFKRALVVDSTFALAAYRLSTVSNWVDDFTNFDLAGAAAKQAARFSARLPPTDRMLLDGMLAFLSDAPDEALRIY